MTDENAVLRLARLSGREPVAFDLRPNSQARETLRAELDLVALPKLRFVGEVRPEGRDDWRLTAEIGATVVQSCVVSLTPVTTRIDEGLSRLYVKDLPETDLAEVEMPEDETIDPLPEELSLFAVMSEALALAVPPYPRATDASMDDAQFTEPGLTPMTDEDARPFAGLKDLRDELSKDE